MKCLSLQKKSDLATKILVTKGEKFVAIHKEQPFSDQNTVVGVWSVAKFLVINCKLIAKLATN